MRQHPGVLPTLRMSTCPPIAVDRLVGLAGVSKNLVGCMEEGRLPLRMPLTQLQTELEKIGTIIEKMADPDIFVWLEVNVRRRIVKFTGRRQSLLTDCAARLPIRSFATLRKSGNSRPLAFGWKRAATSGWPKASATTLCRLAPIASASTCP